MKSKLKKTLLIILPIVIAVMMAIMFSLPSNFEKGRVEQTDNFATADTGAGTAPVSDKGGVLFLEQGATYRMTGGTFTGKNKKYGGAVFVSSGATFEMTGGTITNNSATYGGGIYVQAGGTCIISGGSITSNTANYGPAIYIEDGGNFVLGSSATVDENEIQDDNSYEMAQVGSTSSTLYLRTITFGTYPQHYVGTSMNEELENWFSESKTPVQEYVINSSVTWKAYKYTNGIIYARGTEKRYDSDSKYSDGTVVEKTGRIRWFKVEPITWYILNYEAWQAGEEDIELLSAVVLASDVTFNPTENDGNSWENSNIRNWCNGSFLNSAFTSTEQGMIKNSTVKNNVKGGGSDKEELSTTDKIYLKSYEEMRDSNGVFKNTNANRVCSPSDFAIGNNEYCYTYYKTIYADRVCSWWSRSAGATSTGVLHINFNGDIQLGSSFGVECSCIGIRPALHLNIKP